MTESDSNALRLAQSHFNRMDFVGTPATATMRAALSKLLVDLDANIGLSKFTAIYPFIGESAAAHALDILGTYDITWAGGITHDGDGILGNGSTGKGDTGMPANVLANADAHVAVYMADTTPAGGTTQYYMGVTNASWGFTGLGWANGGLWEVGGIAIGGAGEYAPDSSNTTHGGLLSVTANGTRDGQYYREGSPFSDTTLSAGTVSANNIFLLCYNNNGGGGALFSDQGMRFASMGAGLSAAEQTAFSAALTAFQTTLGRQI